MFQVITLATPFFGVIFIGFFAGKFAKLPRAGLAWLDFFVVYVALPAVFYDVMSRTPVAELAQGRFIATIIASTTTAFLASFAIGMIFARGDARIATFQGLVGSYANVGYMGIGLVLSTFGPEAAAPMALVFCFDVVLVFTLVPIMMTIAGGEKRPMTHTLALVVRRVFTHPFIVSALVGVGAALVGFEAPGPVAALVLFLKSAAAPAALFALGVTVALQPVGRQAVEIPVLLAMKLFAHPLIAWTLLTAVGGFDPLWVKVVILMASLPPAATIFVAAQQYDLYSNRAAAAILIGTIASVFTVTGVLWLITHDAIPMNPWGW